MNIFIFVRDIKIYFVATKKKKLWGRWKDYLLLLIGEEEKKFKRRKKMDLKMKQFRFKHKRRRRS